MGIKDFKQLGQKEYRIYLILVIYLLVGFIAMQISVFFGFPIIGIIIYYPFLAYTLLLYMFALFKKDIKHYSKWKLLGIFIFSLPLMVLFALILVSLFLVSIISYVVLTSIFTLYGCYQGGRSLDEKLYCKKHSWFTRGVEFWGGILIALLMLFTFMYATVEQVIEQYGFSIVILLAIPYVLVMIVVIALVIFSLIFLLGGRLNAWLGTYFIFVAIYTLYLVLRVLTGLTNGTEEGGASQSILLYFGMLVLDLGILFYTISSIFSNSDVLEKKLKVFNEDSILLWLIFSRAAWEFAVNFPYEIIAGIPIGYVELIVQIGPWLNLGKNIAILALFILLALLFGIYGVVTYGKEKEHMKVKKEKKAIETKYAVEDNKDTCNKE